MKSEVSSRHEGTTALASFTVGLVFVLHAVKEPSHRDPFAFMLLYVIDYLVGKLHGSNQCEASK